jgi:hypothetical protein
MQIAVYSLCRVPRVYKNCYNSKLYKTVKTGCKRADGYKIINFLKMYTGTVKMLCCKIKLLFITISITTCFDQADHNNRGKT